MFDCVVMFSGDSDDSRKRSRSGWDQPVCCLLPALLISQDSTTKRHESGFSSAPPPPPPVPSAPTPPGPPGSQQYSHTSPYGAPPPPGAAPAGAGAPTPLPGARSVEDSFVIEVPQAMVGLLIGRGGEKIKELQDRSGANIQVFGLDSCHAVLMIHRFRKIRKRIRRLNSVLLL